VQILSDKIITIPRYLQIYFVLTQNIFDRDHSSVPAKMLLKLPTYIGFAENQLS